MPTIAHYNVTMGKARWAFQRHHGKAGTRAGGRGRSTGHVTTKSNRAPITHLVGGRNVSRKVSCDAIGIYYASTTGNTEAAAEWVKDLMVRSKLVWLGSFSSTRPSLCLRFFQTDRTPKTSLKQPGETTEIQEIGEAGISGLEAHDGLIVGAPTWHTGAASERSGTDWDGFLDDIKALDLKDKPVAVFGLGDSAGYGDNFVDAIEEIHDVFAAAGAKMIGYVPTDGYDYTDSKSIRDGKFLGLPLDANNEDDMTEERVKQWTQQLVDEGMKA
jgi:flavodoxin I